MPDFRNLIIETRIKSGKATVETDIWYFKGRRVREERLIGSQLDQPAEQIWVNIAHCDHKAYYFPVEQGKPTAIGPPSKTLRRSVTF